MDKRTNIVNISIVVVNLLNCIFLLFFTGLFKVPELVIGVVGVIFFILNALFTLILLVLVIFSTIKVIRKRNQLTPPSSTRTSLVSEQPTTTAALPSVVTQTDEKPAEKAMYRGLSSRASTTRSRNSTEIRREMSRGSTQRGRPEDLNDYRPPMPLGQDVVAAQNAYNRGSDRAASPAVSANRRTDSPAHGPLYETTTEHAYADRPAYTRQDSHQSLRSQHTHRSRPPHPDSPVSYHPPEQSVPFNFTDNQQRQY